MDIEGSVALVTGANRGIGASFCRALLERGAATVYAGARDTSRVRMDGVEPVQLDVTSDVDIRAAAERCGDVTLLVNNAGIGTDTAALADDAIEKTREEFETNVFGLLSTSQAFAPILGANGGGAIVNVLSASSWVSLPGTAAYCASKAASWSLTNSLRLELHAQRTQVLALHMGYVDTDKTAHITAPKMSPDDVANQALTGLESGAHEVLADDISRLLRACLSSDVTEMYPVLK
jgi:NAD(P)-dependent dehydrogenase (short-subunit alcohol dehydrogenase family)